MSTLSITFSREAFAAFPTSAKDKPTIAPRVLLEIGFFEDSRPADERPENSAPEAVPRSLRVDVVSVGDLVMELGTPLDGKLTLALLKSDGSAARMHEVAVTNGKAKYAITTADIKALVNAEADPVASTTTRTARYAQLVPIGNARPDFKRSRLAIFTVNKEADLGANGPLGAFGFSKDRTSAVELNPALTDGLGSLSWTSSNLDVQGRFVAQFDLPIATTAATKNLGWVWWLSGDLAAVGFVKDNAAEPNRKPFIIALPAMQAAPGAMDTEEPDCDCEGGVVKSVPTDVTEAELVNNPGVYTEDPGAFCKPFSNPERVIGEKSFAVVARVQQPDISPLPSARLRSQHLLDIDPEAPPIVTPGAHGSNIVVMQPPTREVMVAAMLNTRRPKRFKEPPAVVKEQAELPSGRTTMNAEHPLQWEDDIAQYQAATVALGHILEFRVRTRSNGYSLGNVASTLTLAPRQTKRIQKVEFERLERARRDERTQQTDNVNDSVNSERDYSDTVAAGLSEWATGSSSSGTASAAGGFGFCIPPVVGGAGGGTSSAWSDSSQEGARNTNASEQQRLRDAIRRHGDALRRFQSTVVTEVTQQETVTGTTEVLRNPNYGHSLTVIYYQILRHLKVSTEFAGVRECLFVPFAVKPFTLQRAYRWREAIGKYLRAPRFGKVMTHLRDVITDFQYSGLAAGSRADQRLTYMRGSIYLTLAIERPKDTDDGKYDAAQWLPYASFFGMPAFGIWAKLAARNEALRDQLFQKEHAPTIAQKWTDKLVIKVNGKPLDADFTLATRYGFNQTVRVDFNVPAGQADNYTRAQLSAIKVEALSALPSGSVANVGRMSIRYGTANFERTIEALSGVDDLVEPESGAIDARGAELTFLLDAWDNVNEREVLRNSVNELIEHLNEHVEFYHKAIWWNMDRDRLLMMLDGFYVPDTNSVNGNANVSIASVVDREPVAIIGNSLVYRVGAGAFIGYGKVTTPTQLYNAYAGREPAQDPLLISLPTDGLYAQTIMDECLALEEHQGSVDWVLNDPDPDLGTIDPSLMTSRRADASSTLTPTQMPGTIINLQNAPEAPAPTGLGAALTAVGNANAFRDMAGLAGTQANAAAALQTAAGLATNFGNQAAAIKMADMANKAQATENVNQQMAAVQKAKDAGLISDADAAEHINKILGGMHSSERNKPYEDPTLADAIALASGTPGSVIESTTADGQVRVEMNDQSGATATAASSKALQPWELPDTFWFQNAKQQVRFTQPDPETEEDPEGAVGPATVDVTSDLRRAFMVETQTLPGAVTEDVTSGTTVVDSISVQNRWAVFKYGSDAQQMADSYQAVGAAELGLWEALRASTAAPEDIARARECLDGFTTSAPLNFLISESSRHDAPFITPATGKTFIDLADIGNAAKKQAAIRFTVDRLIGSAKASKDELIAELLHELVHVLLIRRGQGAEVAWQKALKNPLKSTDLVVDKAQLLAYLHVVAQEEVFCHKFIRKIFGGTASEAELLYVAFISRSERCFKSHGGTFTAEAFPIKVGRKAGGAAVSWALTIQVPQGFKFEDKDLAGLDRVIGTFPPLLFAAP